MRNSVVILSALTAFSVSNQANAAFLTVPSTGFADSAYTGCYNAGRIIPSGGVVNNVKGNFGSYLLPLANYPAAGSNDTCWVPKPVNYLILPAGKTGYTLVGSRTAAIPTTTGGAGDIGTVLDVAWRNSITGMCIIGTQVQMKNADHDSGNAGTQYFEVNDIARGGFANSGDVNVAYTIFASPVTDGSPVYRVGRTFTSVQHRALQYESLANREQNGINYLDLPTKNSVTTAFTGESLGVGAWTPASTSLSTQDAAVNAGWVDFTTEVVYIDQDGEHGYLHPSSTFKIVSPFLYIEAPCATNPVVQAGAVRLRQTGQQWESMKEISVSGYAIEAP
jgi:hypothetical protein